MPEAPSVLSKEPNAESKDGLPPKAVKDKSQKTRRPQPLIKLVMRRLQKLIDVLALIFFSLSSPLLFSIISCSLSFEGVFSCFCPHRLESSFRSFSRPVLHAAARVVQEMGKSRAAAFAVGLQDIDEGVNVNTFTNDNDSLDPDLSDSEGSLT